MKGIRIHVVSHTHWDREWFLSSDYTNKWLVPFFDRLFSLFESNKNYKFVLDGQMQMVRDYLSQLSAEEREKKTLLLRKYGKEKRLFFGPYWSQIDWKIAGAESSVRNILIGRKFAKMYGNFMKVGWLLDNFGQIGQIPQIHKLFGLNSVFVWRGISFPNDEVKSEFLWQSPNGSKVVASYFLDSYRNFMGLNIYPQIAFHRIENEVKKMEPFLISPNVLLMNGYDLDNHPEDPFEVLNPNGHEKERIFQSDPPKYISDVKKSKPVFVMLKGEQLSGRYLSVFPGTLSSRVYLKMWNYLCEYMLTKLIEPIGTITWYYTGYYPHKEVEELWQQLLTNETHDNIAGVGVDQIHAQMEKRYEKMMIDSKKLLQRLLSTIMGKFSKNSVIVFNTNPFPVTLCLEVNGEIIILEKIPSLGYKVMKKIKTHKISHEIQEIKEFSWENDFYRVSINSNGTLDVYDKSSKTWYKNAGYFYDEGDAGDEYNYSPPPKDKTFTNQNHPAKISLVYKTPFAAKIRVETQMQIPEFLDEDKRSDKRIILPIKFDISFDNTPIIKYNLSVKNVARDHRMKMVFPTIEDGEIVAEMPFEYVKRHQYVDNSRPIPENLKKLIIGARECEKEYAFPMKDFVAMSDGSKTFAVMAKGLCEYEVREKKLFITLLRSVEWVAKNDLKTRIGDAGPAMYTPDAQCLREINYEIGLFVGKGNIQHSDLTKWSQIFHNPPILVKVNESGGKEIEEFSFLNVETLNLKLTSMKISEDGKGMIIRFFNPYDKPQVLDLSKRKEKIFKVNLFERPIQQIKEKLEVLPHEILTLKFELQHRNEKYDFSSFRLLIPAFNSPSKDKSDFQDPKILEYLKRRKTKLLNHMESLNSKIQKLDVNKLEYHKRMFELLCAKRTYLETELSLLLNEEIRAEDERKERLKKRIEEVGLRLNDARIKRRAYEYVLDYWKTVLND